MKNANSSSCSEPAGTVGASRSPLSRYWTSTPDSALMAATSMSLENRCSVQLVSRTAPLLTRTEKVPSSPGISSPVTRLT